MFPFNGSVTGWSPSLLPGFGRPRSPALSAVLRDHYDSRLALPTLRLQRCARFPWGD